MTMALFPQGQAVGMFRGAAGSGFEFHADLTLPYREDFHSVPMHGQFVLVELASPDEAVLGRITAVAAQGRLTSTAGEEYGLRAVSDNRAIPDDLRRQYLRYRIDVRLLGVLRIEDTGLVFAPSHRRLPHVGARVAFLPDDILEHVAGGTTKGADLGFYALGEFVYAGTDPRLEKQRWMQVMDPAVTVRFAIGQLVARRTFVFARAGFGKSNLIKLLFANLYSGDPPAYEMRDGREVGVGTVLFDPDGEYFFPDVSGRPGLCDVEELADRIVVFTNQEPPTDFYGAFRVAGVRLDIRQLPAPLVLSIALSPEQQQQQNVHKLKALRGANWRAMVDEIHRAGNAADETILRTLLNLQPGQDAELYAARANMTRVVSELHDPASEMLSLLLRALRDGKLCVVDISRMRGPAGLALSGIVLRHIFSHNQEQFTRAEPDPIPTIAVIEEAQSVLGGRGSGESAYEEWVKEGRKYSLGAVLVTQQPGSIPPELLSQGDSWFIFHLLSSGDLRAVKAANAHFSDDLLSSLLNEPLPGNGVFWSSVSGRVDEAGNAYPIPLRVLSFEGEHEPRDPKGDREPPDIYASQLAQQSEDRLRKASDRLKGGTTESEHGESPEPPDAEDAEAELGETDADADAQEELDRDEVFRRAAIEHLRQDDEVRDWIEGSSHAIPWMGIQESLREGLPDQNAVPDPHQWSYDLVIDALIEIYGPQGEKWEIERRPKKNDPARTTAWIVFEGP